MLGYLCACGYPQELNTKNKVCGELIVGDGAGYLRAILECFGLTEDRVFNRNSGTNQQHGYLEGSVLVSRIYIYVVHPAFNHITFNNPTLEQVMKATPKFRPWARSSSSTSAGSLSAPESVSDEGSEQCQSSTAADGDESKTKTKKRS